MIPGFEQGRLGGLAYAKGGSGPPLVLLHGFPQTHAMWHKIAPQLAETHTVICPDLPGYGDSTTPDLDGSSFRAMSVAVLGLLDALEIERFAVAGHDRGGRVAHRMCLDAPARVSRAALMDIVPTHTILSALQLDVARAYYHWFFLAQPEPFPDRMIAANPDAYFESCLTGWGSAALSDFDADALAAYRAAWRRPEVIRGMLNDYRAGVTLDMADDTADLGARIACPSLILYGSEGVMAKSYDVASTWAPKCTYMEALAIPGGHFFPDTAPDDTAKALNAFFSAH